MNNPQSAVASTLAITTNQTSKAITMIITSLTEMFDLQHPVVLGPMGGVSGGRLAAAVSNAGGLGLVGGGYGNADWLRTELTRVSKQTSRPWGVGFITWSLNRSILDLALDYCPDAVMLSFGDPSPYTQAIKSAGCWLICQVQDVVQAKAACAAGADLIVAEGAEAGGHSGSRATFPLVPAIVDAVHPVPVIAAGGIGDGRGLAAALMLGAQGVLLGTRFYATHEALGQAAAKQRIVAAAGGDTAHTRAFDIVRGLEWPAQYPGRALRNRFMEQWQGRDDELRAAAQTAGIAYQQAVEAEDYETAVVWAGEVVDLIKDIEDAETIVQRISAEAEVLLQSAGRFLR